MWTRWMGTLLAAGTWAGLAALPGHLAAQRTAEGHAAIGTLKSVDARRGTLTVIAIGQGERVFRLTPMTAVHGLGAHAETDALTGREGASLWVHYVGEEEAPLARAVQYIGWAGVKAADGLLVRVLTRQRELVIERPWGVEEAYVVSERAPIDLAAGLVSLDVLGGQRGLLLTVYYTMLGPVKVVWLVTRGPPAVS